MSIEKLDLFGLLTLTVGLVFYSMEKRGRWAIMGFAYACAGGSVYGFLQGAWPFGIIEAIWALVAVKRWHDAR